MQQTGGLLDGLPNLHNPRHSDRKGRTTTGLAFDRDVPAHHLAEPPADDEPKASATVFARRGGGSLRKLLKQLTHLIWRHADASVLHRKRDPAAAIFVSLAGIDGDGAAISELVGVAHEVQ